jgi:hypothetical protein
MAEGDETLAGQFAEIKVDELLVQTATMLASIAFLRLSEGKPDLEQAKLAIDSIRALQRPLADFLTDELKGELNGLVASLQMAYVNAVVPASAAEAPVGNGEASEAEPSEPA